MTRNIERNIDHYLLSWTVHPLENQSWTRYRSWLSLVAFAGGVVVDRLADILAAVSVPQGLMWVPRNEIHRRVSRQQTEKMNE